MEKFLLEDINPHSFPINVCLTLIDGNLAVSADM